ncbi:Uncharacterised protein [Streptococcus pneumoniae]|nr:Uncharacterised protein [Streptococcus pneumoniae]
MLGEKIRTIHRSDFFIGRVNVGLMSAVASIW